jgi:UDP-glucose 4-epimerase
VKFVRADFSDAKKVGDLLRDDHPDAVYFFAAHSLVSESISLPGKYYDNNITGLLALLGTIARYNTDSNAAHKVKQFVFSSSAASYGEPAVDIIDENVPNNPIQTYGDTKFLAERILIAFGKSYGLKTTFLRYFNVFGASVDGSIGEDHSPETHLVPLLMELPLVELIVAELAAKEREGAVLTQVQLDLIKALVDKNIVPQLSAPGANRPYIDMPALMKIHSTLRGILRDVYKKEEQGAGMAGQGEALGVLKDLALRAKGMGLLLDGKTKDPVTGETIPAVTTLSTPDKTPIRDYIDAVDLARAHEAALTHELNGAFNCGTGKGNSSREITDGVKDILRGSFPDIDDRLDVRNARLGDPAVLIASSHKLQQATGWKSEIDFRDSLTHAWTFLSTHLAGYGDKEVKDIPNEIENVAKTVVAVKACEYLSSALKFEIIFRVLVNVFQSDKSNVTAQAFAHTGRVLLTRVPGEQEKVVTVDHGTQ